MNKVIDEAAAQRMVRAVHNVQAFATYASDKLPKHVSEDLQIVLDLAQSAMQRRPQPTTE